MKNPDAYHYNIEYNNVSKSKKAKRVCKRTMQVADVVRNHWTTLFDNNHCVYNCISAQPSKKSLYAFSDFMQTTFFYLGKSLKKLADDQCSSITIDSIYHIKHLYIQPFTTVVD